MYFQVKSYFKTHHTHRITNFKRRFIKAIPKTTTINIINNQFQEG
jgi:hypothetical protein